MLVNGYTNMTLLTYNGQKKKKKRNIKWLDQF